jgi:cyclopropane fatty-acyl-phospholipid synthase-like methyltransferase
LPRIRSIYADISEVPAEIQYDRITSVATLEHICNLPEVIARSALLLAKDGVFRASIPSEVDNRS